jgi:hypothetical protein
MVVTEKKGYFGRTRGTLGPERNNCIGAPVTPMFVSARSLPSAKYLIPSLLAFTASLPSFLPGSVLF